MQPVSIETYSIENVLRCLKRLATLVLQNNADQYSATLPRML